MNVLAAWKHAVNLLVMQKVLNKRLEKAVAAQAKYYNFKHLTCQYNVGNLVYFNSKNIDSTCLTKKLDQKFYGPYKMIEHIDKIAYWLNLPTLTKIHNAFHVLLLKPCDPEKDDKRFFLSPPIKIDGKEEFKVKEILDSRSHYGKLQYLIKWLRYSDIDNQWIYKDQVTSSSNLVKLSHRLYPKKPCKGKREKS